MSKLRKVLDTELKELDEPVELRIITKVPTKWMLIDMETGQSYIGTKNKEIGKQWKQIKR